MYRTIDANINRLREAIRVIEDILRFEYDDTELFTSFKIMRHEIEYLLKGIESQTIASRKSDYDVGEKTITESEMTRENIYSVVKANFLRSEEASRVLEEAFKVVGDGKKSETAKNIRFRMYALEKKSVELIKGFEK